MHNESDDDLPKARSFEPPSDDGQVENPDGAQEWQHRIDDLNARLEDAQIERELFHSQLVRLQDALGASSFHAALVQAEAVDGRVRTLIAELHDNLATAHPLYCVLDFGWDFMGITREWRFVTARFTRKAAEAYLAANHHNLQAPRVFVTSQHRCPEWQAVVALLKALAPGPETTGPRPEDSDRGS